MDLLYSLFFELSTVLWLKYESIIIFMLFFLNTTLFKRAADIWQRNGGNMYSEKSVEMKSDFYSRYGCASGHLFFERAGLPCVLMKSETHMLAFSFKCGIRACGRKYGDVIKILDTNSNVCDISFVKSGTGAQILYCKDMDGLIKTDETTSYVIDKLLVRMGLDRKYDTYNTLSEICDVYGSSGWCAYSNHGNISQIPLPLSKYNVILIKTPKNSRYKSDKELSNLFNNSETERIEKAVTALKVCEEERFFNLLNQSQADIEKFMSPPKIALKAVKAAQDADALAVRICNHGVVCITPKNKTDCVIHRISVEFERVVGYSATIAVVC